MSDDLIRVKCQIGRLIRSDLDNSDIADILREWIFDSDGTVEWLESTVERYV